MYLLKLNNCDELTVQDGLIFKSDQVIIPTSLRQDVIQQVHSSHLGVEGCLRSFLLAIDEC